MATRCLIWAALLVAACGGRVETDGESGPSNGAYGSGDEPASGAGPLGPCVLGSKPSGQSCPYLGDGRCYPTKAAACNCICPRDHDSWCVTDMDDPAQASSFVECY